MTAAITTKEDRVLVLAPTSGDRRLTRSVLAEAQIDCHLCDDLAQLVRELRDSAGAILLTDEVIRQGSPQELAESLAQQPSWSDLPIVMLSSSGDESTVPLWPIEELGNVTVLERPVRLTTLVSALRSALRARRRQYELRDQIKALERSEERFRELADNIAQSAWSADSSGRATWYNQRWYEYTGTSWDQMRDQGWEFLVHPEHWQRVQAKYANCLERGTVWEDTFPMRGVDGRFRWFLSRSVPIRDAAGRITRWFGTNTDVTEQRATEEALRASEARMKQLLSLMPMAVYTCDSEGKINFFNRKAAELWGRSPVIGDEDQKFCGACRLWRSDGSHLPHDETPMARALSEGRSTRGEPVVIEQPGGPRVVVSVNIDPLYDAQGTRIGAINVFEDITDRIEAEEALRTANRRKDEFLAMLAHELRNPLAPIRTGLQVIQLCGDDRETMLTTLKMMDRQVRHLVRLIDDLLDISRVTRGRIELRPEVCDLETILSVAIEGSMPAIEEAGVELTVSTPRQRVEFEADPARLAQVFSNLLTNAAKYSRRGGHIWLSAERKQGVLAVTVRDDGIGIRPEMLTQIFEMFTQVDRGERSQGGLGLGLSLVRALVEMHGGTVEAHSAGLGEGSEFVVHLPLAEALEKMPPLPPPSFETSGACKVLVVDDNVDAVTTLATMLRLVGHDVRTGHDGFQAVELTESFRPDVVLLDLGMPKLDGYQAAERIRQQPWGQNVKLVALTGWGQDEDRRRSMTAGFDAHLVKPVALDALNELLASSGKNSSSPG